MNTHSPLIDRSTSLLQTRFIRWLIVLAVLAGLMFAVAARSSGDGKARLNPPETARFVRVEAVQLDASSQALRLPGILRASDNAELAFLHAGHLAERRVRRGEQVNAGQILALLHNPSLSPALTASEARLREVRTELDQAEREARRLEDLHQRNLVSTEELERIRSRRNALNEAVEQAEARRREASEQLAEASLRAPFAGTVIDFHAETGEFVGAGQPILSLAGNGSLEVALEVGARRATELRPGQTVQVGEHGGNFSVSARLIEVGLAGAGRPAPVRLRLEQRPDAWQPGLGVQVLMDFAPTERLSVPLPAIIDPGGGQPRVFRLDQDRAQLVPIRLGQVSGGRIMIEGELSVGDLIVVAGHGQLLDGEPVRVLP